MKTVNYQCPACGAPLAFNAETGKLSCEFCGSSFTVAEVEAYFAAKQQAADKEAEAANKEATQAEAAAAAERVQDANAASSHATKAKSGDPISDYLSSKKTMEMAQAGTIALNCTSCGAGLIVDNRSAVTQCPYCGNNSIVPGNVGGVLEPDFVIPFTTTKDQAVAKLKEHYKGKALLPKVFKSQNHIEEIQGIYVPFWLYDGKSEGSAEYRATNIRTWSDSKYDYTETSNYAIWRKGNTSFTRVPVDGSKKMPDDFMDSIEPYDYNKMVPFSVAYLPGFAAERYDDSVTACAPRAKGRMENSLNAGLENSVVGYQTVSRVGGHTETDITKVSYALLPVWMLHTRWNDKDFLFAMNGQTGKLVGDLPADKKKGFLAAIGSFVAAFVVAFVVTGFIF